MNSKVLKKKLRDRCSEVGLKFVDVPKSEWPKNSDPKPIRVLRNRQFIVQVYGDRSHIRISVNRASATGFRSDNSPIWKDGISWDELQNIKTAIGFGDRWAVECYPPDKDVINVANMRHLWLLDEVPPFGWINSD